MKIDTVQQYNDYFGIETSHPLVSVIEGKCAKPLRFCKKLYNVYTILLKDTDCGNLKYGQSIYDYQRCFFDFFHLCCTFGLLIRLYSVRAKIRRTSVGCKTVRARMLLTLRKLMLGVRRNGT